MNTSVKTNIDRRLLLRGSAALVGAAYVRGSAQEVIAAAQESGGTLTYAQNLPITSPDPIRPEGYPAAYEANFTIYNNLVTFDRDLSIVPALAESWETSEDGLTWTFQLRNDVTFHDGTPFNAQAVEAHIARNSES